MHVRQLDCIEPPEVPDPRGAHTHLQTLFQAPPHIRKIGGQKGQRDSFSGAEGEQQLLQECTTPHTSCPYLSLILGEAFSYYKNVANSVISRIQIKINCCWRKQYGLRNLYHNLKGFLPSGEGQETLSHKKTHHWHKTQVWLLREREVGLLWKLNSQSSGW